MGVNKSLCSDAGVCLAFGTLADAIKQHFNGFTSFDYVKAPIKRIGEESVNGFINQIEYEHRGYRSCAILKSSKTADADNLLYEYVVGQYINKLNKQYPCFLETYGYYIYTADNYWHEMQDKPLIQDQAQVVSILKKGLAQQHYLDYNDACRESSKLAILIQYLKGIQSLQKLAMDRHFIENELMWALFQLYAPLAKLKNNFTHYDLHLENVYLYKPVEGKYIEYHYYISTTRAITFKSSYMLKIIDYGRSFFRDEQSGLNSKIVYETELCGAADDCNDEELTGNCGEKVGFGWLRPSKRNPAENYFISAQKKNISHDLLPLKRILNGHTVEDHVEQAHVAQAHAKSLPPHKPNLLTPDLLTLLQKVVYTDEFGTAEITDSGYPNTISNVQDAAKMITDYITSSTYMNKNNHVYAGKTKLGDLYVYMNGTPMKFVPVTTSSA